MADGKSARKFDDRERLEAHQLDRLRVLLEELARHNAFYSDRLRNAGLAGGVQSLAEFAAKMPFTTKEELAADQRANPPYGTNLTYPLERYVRIHQTSSTTGEPLRWLDTAEDWAWMKAAWKVVWEGAEITPADRLFFAFSFGPFIGFWLGFEAAQELGCLCIPGGPTDSVTRLHLMERNAVTALCCTPTYAIRLGEVAREEGIDATRFSVRSVVVGGEPGGSVPATRARIEDLWDGARVFDHYGMTEVGPVTYQTPDADDVVRIVEEHYLCEVVDPATGAPFDPASDALGELVITTLGRAGAPLLRYRTRDLVRPRFPTKDFPHLLLEGGIQARADQMVVVRGVNLYPSAVDQIVRDTGGVAEYRVEIDKSGAMTELELLVEPEPNCRDKDELCAALVRAFRTSFSLRIPVRAVPAGELPRFELKARRWIVI